MSYTVSGTVAFINDPKPGKKWGSIKLESGDLFFGPPALLAQFALKEMCTFEADNFGDNGHKVVKKLDGEPPLPPTPRAASAATHEAPKTNGNLSYRQPCHPLDAEQMWVNGIIQAYIGAGQVAFEVTDLVEKVNILRESYRLTFGKQH